MVIRIVILPINQVMPALPPFFDTAKPPFARLPCEPIVG